MDKSASMSRKDWGMEKQFVSEMIKHFDIGEDKVRVAVSLFAINVRHKFCFTQYNQKDELLAAVKDLTCKMCKRGQTGIGETLQHTRENVLTEECGAREGVDKVVILITDGKSTEDYSYWSGEAKALKNQVSKVITVGVGKIDQGQLEEIASSKNHAYLATNFVELLGKIGDVLKGANCDAGAVIDNKSPCEKGWTFNVISKKCYKFFGTPASLEGAVGGCKKNKAAMPTISSKNDHKFLASISEGNTWLPLVDEKQNGEFKWQDGSGLEYDDMWNKGRPNGIKKGLDQYCTIMTDNFLRKWSDVSCDGEYSYICEKDQKD